MAHHAFLSTDLARFPFRLSTRVKPPSASNNIPHIAEHHHAHQRTHLQRKVRTTRKSLPITKASSSANPKPLSPVTVGPYLPANSSTSTNSPTPPATPSSPSASRSPQTAPSRHTATAAAPRSSATCSTAPSGTG